VAKTKPIVAKKETMNLKALRFFVTTADTLSFTQAGEILNTPKSNVSKSIHSLESELGVKLFERSSRVVRLTESGALLYQRATNLLNDATSMVNDIKSLQTEVSGELRISAPPSLGRYISKEIIPEFLSRFENVRVSLKLTYDYDDLVKDDLDIAFRMGKNNDENLIEKPLGFANRVIVASPQYLKTHTQITSISDLTSHKCLQVFDNITTSWQLKNGEQQQQLNLAVLFKCDDMDALRQTLISGIGIAHLPWLVVRDDIAAGRLCHVLPQWSSHGLPISVVYRTGVNKPAKLAQFLALVYAKQAHFNIAYAPD